MKNVILAYDSIGDSLRLELFAESAEQLAKRMIPADKKTVIPRFDLLQEITGFLAQNAVVPESLMRIIFVHGPGRFTAVRTACIVANAFASELATRLSPITINDLERVGSDFGKLIASSLHEVSFAEPLFNGAPSIAKNVKY